MPELIDHEAREVAVAEAAWRVLGRSGVRGLSVRTVADEAGLAVGSLRRSFPSQFALVAFCVRLVAERVGVRVRTLPHDGDPLVIAQQSLEQLLPLDLERRLEAQVWLSLSLEALADDDLRVVCDGLDQELRRLVSSVVSRLVGSRPSGQAPEELYAVVDGLALHLLRQDPEEATDWAQDVLHRTLERIVADVSRETESVD